MWTNTLCLISAAAGTSGGSDPDAGGGAGGVQMILILLVDSLPSPTTTTSIGDTMTLICRAIASSRQHQLLPVAVAHASRSTLRRSRRRCRDSHVACFWRTVSGTSSSSTEMVGACASDEQVVHPPGFNQCFAMGAVIAAAASSSAAASLLGRNENSNLRYVGNDNSSASGRLFSNINCHCESNTSKTSPPSSKTSSTNGSDSSGVNDLHDSKSTQDCSTTKSVSTFFDMAQQWARDFSTTSTDGHSRQIKPPPSDIQAAEAALLSAMGIARGDTNRSDYPRRDGDRQNDNAVKDTKQNDTNMLQRIMVGLDEIKSALPKMASTLINDEKVKNDSESKTESNKVAVDDESSSSTFTEFVSLAKNASLFATTNSSPSAAPTIEELIQQAQRIAANHASTSSSQQQSNSSGFLSQVLYLQQNAYAIQRAFESAFGNTDYFADIAAVKDIFRSVNWVAALHYYLEQEDSIKTPSWKRRMHRYQRDVEVTKVEELNEALILSELSYADSVDDIRSGLEKMYHGKDVTGDNEQLWKRNKPQWELLFCDLESRPNQPSHFLAIQKNASPYDDVLHVLMVVRGTKTMSDLITDAMMEATDYEYAPPGLCDENNNPIILRGQAHGGMQESGKYLVGRHQQLLSTLLRLSKKRKIEITLIGHSLGAGAATIAAMEWNSMQSLEGKDGSTQGNNIAGGNNSDIQVSAHVIGFGCPALLSKPLSHATKDFVTTVIADADFIPRMSGATLVNLLLDVKDFDYQMQAERDVEQALREVQNRLSGQYTPPFQSKLSFNITDDDIQSVMGYVRRGLETVSPTTSTSNIAETTKESVDEGHHYTKKVPVLFPPGECIHFYRDGSGISGTYVNCDFFNEVSHSTDVFVDTTHLYTS